MIRIHQHRYEYQEECNEGILRQFCTGAADGPEWVLDVGCGAGVLGHAIRKQGYHVVGVEAHPEAVQRARNRLDDVFQADLTQLDQVQPRLAQRQFDHLVFSDVLEHLYDPFSILNAYLGFLRPGGRVLISVPNVAAWTIRLSLLGGSFRYADTGIMDRTHIRFFTFKTARQLVAATGCVVNRTDHTPYFVRAALPWIKHLMKARPDAPGAPQLIDSPAYRWYMQFIYPVEYCLAFLSRGLFSFRIIVIGTKP